MYSERIEAAQLGRDGENAAAEYLRRKGYIIVKRNWRDNRYGEIDIIAENQKEIIFVEVRTRRENALVSASESVDANKLRRVKNAALIFMGRFNTKLPYRVDVIEMTPFFKDGKRAWKLKQIKNV